MWRAQPVRGTGEHDAGASKPVSEYAELLGSIGLRLSHARQPFGDTSIEIWPYATESK
jgi:hypothetical protein